MTVRSTFRFLLILAAFFSLRNAFAGVASVDSCVQGLYGMGGMAKDLASQTCHLGVTAEAISCQNKKFLQDFQDPNEALKACQSATEITPPQSSPYRGSFENIPAVSALKTVCSITVNSSDERESFRSNLNPKEYNWVELLPFNSAENANRFIPRDDNWIKRACAQKIKCDILVISGHFASSFIGSSGFEVKLEDLTKYSCDANCAELFASVKQVYLFGCNTLATNAADSRTITQYREILIQDGVLPHQAQRIAARRYTVYDQTISEEFRKVFPMVEDIFGFSKPSPTGPHIKPVLYQYIRSAYSNNSNRDKVFEQTLGASGMKTVTRLNRDELTCQSKANRLRKPEMRNLAALENYVKTNALALPIPALDLIQEARIKNIISSSDADRLVKNILEISKKENLKLRQHLLCPLLATEHAVFVPVELGCKASISWLEALPNL